MLLAELPSPPYVPPWSTICFPLLNSEIPRDKNVSEPQDPLQCLKHSWYIAEQAVKPTSDVGVILFPLNSRVRVYPKTKTRLMISHEALTPDPLHFPPPSACLSLSAKGERCLLPAAWECIHHTSPITTSFSCPFTRVYCYIGASHIILVAMLPHPE